MKENRWLFITLWWTGIFLLIISGCTKNPVSSQDDSTINVVNVGTADTIIDVPTDCYIVTDSGIYWVPCSEVPNE